MGIFLNPNEDNSFKDLLKDELFVDKTDFIAEISGRIDKPNKLVAFTKPRRFGKTVTAGMLSSFFSRGCNSGPLFEDLKIAGLYGKEKGKDEKGRETEVSYRYIDRHLNRHNVIYIDMNAVSGLFSIYQKEMPRTGVTDMVDFLEYTVISELKAVPEFQKILADSDIKNIGLYKALTVLNKDPLLSAKFIFIMDEWDLIYREYRDNEKLQIRFINLLQDLFKSGPGLSCFSLAYLTGILPIKKYNSQSALNNFDEYNMLLSGTFAPYFGFTDEEVTELSRLPRCHISKDMLKEWYEGYKFSPDAKDEEQKINVPIDVYNPNSVCRAISRNRCSNYWSSTSSNEEVIRLINMNFDGIKDDIISLISGGRILFDCESFQNDMTSIDSRDQIFSLLVCLGYLGCTDEGDFLRSAYVPNREIRSVLSSIVRRQPWYSSLPVIVRSEKLFQAIRSRDAVKTAEIVGSIHNSSYVSVIGYNREEALVFCLISGLMWCAESSYDSFRELPAGKGFADLVFVPKNRTDLPIMIVEFKRDCSAWAALNQIKEQDYAGRYRKDGDEREVLLIGLSYNSGTREHECLIERM